MALSHSIMAALVHLKEKGAIGTCGSILEIGEQNWYNDVPMSDIGQLIDRFAPEANKPAFRERLAQLIEDAKDESKLRDAAFAAGRLFYRILFDAEKYLAIDLHGTQYSVAHDLNFPVPITEQYDIVTDLGTAEHVFDVAQVFKTIHALTKPGGMMLHALPNQGMYDHGFYNFQPTFFYDLASANHYEIVAMFYVDITGRKHSLRKMNAPGEFVELVKGGGMQLQSMIYVLFKKPAEEKPFAIPRQGHYSDRATDESIANWEKLSRGGR